MARRLNEMEQILPGGTLKHGFLTRLQTFLPAVGGMGYNAFV
jgi:hypothetical protein